MGRIKPKKKASQNTIDILYRHRDLDIIEERRWLPALDGNGMLVKCNWCDWQGWIPWHEVKVEL